VTDLDFPYAIDDRGRTATTTYEDHVRDLIEQLLLTSQGERVNRPDFGSGLLQLVFAPSGPEVAAALQFAMQAALQRWLGDVIEPRSLEVTSIDSTLSVSLEYALRSTGEVRTDVFQAGGGS
jgi:phage baseplate assembly protein W